MFRTAGWQTRFWLIALAVLVAALWLLKPVLLPFFAGTAIAYFLNPVVDRLSRSAIPRWLGALIVLAGFTLVIALIVILVGPLLENQIGALVNAVPDYIERGRENVIPWFEDWLTRFSPEDMSKIRTAAGNAAGNAATLAGNALKDILTTSLALIDILALLVITPVVAFYLMRDWPQLVNAIDFLIPRRHYNVVKEQLGMIDASLSGFVRGQALVCLSLGLIYSLGLTAVGLQYGAAIGVVAGIFSFIPYVGTTFCWITSIILALVQFDDMSRVGLVIAVLLIGHVMEAYVLTPRLVGHRVGLHPVWILFALIAGARLMGFSGVLIAVPTAAVLGVLARFALSRYRQSSLYKDPLAPQKP